MQLLELPHTLIEKIQRLLQPILAVERANGQQALDVENGWRRISTQLSGWQQAPQALDDDTIEPPRRGVLERAAAVVAALSAAGVESPDTLVPNGDGGLVLRWRTGQRTWWIELDRDGSMEAYLMHDGRLVWRHALHEDQPEPE